MKSTKVSLSDHVTLSQGVDNYKGNHSNQDKFTLTYIDINSDCAESYHHSGNQISLISNNSHDLARPWDSANPHTGEYEQALQTNKQAPQCITNTIKHISDHVTPQIQTKHYMYLLYHSPIYMDEPPTTFHSGAQSPRPRHERAPQAGPCPGRRHYRNEQTRSSRWKVAKTYPLQGFDA